MTVKSVNRFAILSLPLLVQACSLAIGAEEFEPTDLSSLTVGTAREEVERVLGKPTMNVAKTARDINIYSYNKGGSVGPVLEGRDYLECWGVLNIFCEPILTPIMLVKRQNSYESQRGQIAIRYSPADAVIDVIIGELDFSDRFLDSVGRAVCGDADAQYQVGDAFESGRGVRASEIDAYKWYSISASADNPLAARVKDLLLGRMSPDQIAEAEILVAEWEPERNRCEIDIAPAGSPSF